MITPCPHDSIFWQMKKRLLIIMAAVVVCALGAFLYVQLTHGTSFPELLPANTTIGYISFSTAFEDGPEARILLSERLNIDWDKDAAPWIGDDAAVVFLKNVDDKEVVTPLILAHTRSPDIALATLKSYHNSSQEIKEKRTGTTSIYSTPSLHFAFIGTTVVVGATQNSVEAMLAAQAPLTSRLSKDSNFIEVHKGSTSPYFAYLQPGLIPKSGLNMLSNFAGLWPEWPFIEGVPAIGVNAWKEGGNWQGTSYVALNSILTLEPEHAYRAALLSLVPSDTAFMLSGQDLPSQLNKLSMLQAKNAPAVAVLVRTFIQNYFGKTATEKILSLLLNKEFLLAQSPAGTLFAAQVPSSVNDASIASLRDAFVKNAAQFTPTERVVTLRDDSTAAELVPDPSRITVIQEPYEGTTIHGVLLGHTLGLFDAVIAGKWLVSDNIELVKNAIAVTRGKLSDDDFRDSSVYRESLQPILKNPELLGIAVLPKVVFSFSKRTFASHMETDFVVSLAMIK